MKTVQSCWRYAISGLHFFVVFLLVAGGLLLFDAKKIFPMVRMLARFQLRIVGLRLKILGLEHFEKGRAYLMLGNHESLFDIFAIPAAIPNHAVGIEAAGHFKWPLWGYLTSKWGNIPAYRKELPRAIKSLQKAARLIESGTPVVVLPEGHRTLTGRIGPFKKGPFHLALEAKSDILPFVLSGLYEFNNKHSWHLNPRSACVIFGKPIPFKSIETLSVEELSDYVRNKMIALKKSADCR